MYRALFGLLSILPWWMYAILSLAIGAGAATLWDDYLDKQAAAESAIVSGPPDTIAVGTYDGRRGVAYLDELSVEGLIRADLGIGRLSGDTLAKTYIVLDNDQRRGPLVALMFVGSDEQDDINTLISNADQRGQVTVAGFHRMLDRSEVTGQLRLQGVDRDIYLVNPYFGDRAATLREKATSDFPFTVIVTALAVLCALIAAWRFRRWRKRRAAVRPRRQTGGSGKSNNRRRPSSSPKPAEASPWGTFTPIDGNAAQASGGNPPPLPDAARDGLPKPTPATNVRPQLADSAKSVPESPTEPEFVSVFPGGGSGFKFKTADQIIRQTFGTLSSLDTAKQEKERG